MLRNFQCNFLIANFIFLLVLYIPLNSQNKAPCQALIIDFQGNVKIKPSDKSSYEKAIWGTQLFSGDQIKTLDNSQVSLLFVNRNLITLGANSSLTISQTTFTGNKGSIPAVNLDKALPEDLPLFSIRENENGEVGVLAGLRSGSQKEITLLSPRNSKIKTVQPSFKWYGDTEYDQFIVNLFDDNGKIWTMHVEDTSLDYPQDKIQLDYGRSYFWYVEAKGLFETYRSESVGFNIAAREEYQMVEAETNRIIRLFKEMDFSNTHRFVLGTFHEKEGFFQDAIANYEIIAQQNPDAPLPQRILGKVYQKIGLTDKAINALEKAEQLCKKNE